MTSFTPTGFTGGYTANSQSNLLYYSEYSAVADLYVHIIDFLTIPSGEVPDLDSYTLNGQGRLIKEFYIDVTPSVNDSLLGVDNITLEDYTIKSANCILYQNNSSRTRGNSTKYNSNDSFYYRYTRNILVNIAELSMEQSDYIIESVAHFKVFVHHFKADNWYSLNGKIGVNITVSNTGTVTNRFNWLKNNWQFNREIISALKSGNASILDTLQNDSTGASSALSTNIGLYDTAESQASSAMAGALPNADTELGSVTSYNYGSIYNDNVSAFSFWKSIGDFILSNSNLVGIGALLILCMFLGLVVYLLRL